MRKLAVLLALLATVPVLATDYYVDCVNGDDSNNGTSPAQAWETLSKVESITLQAGDTVNLKRGCVFHEDFVPVTSNNGTAENPIIVTAYGQGDPPVIDGGTPVSPSAFVYAATNRYYTDWTQKFPSYFTVGFEIDGLFYWGDEEASVSDLDQPFEWYYDSATSRLYIYVPSPLSAEEMYDKVWVYDNNIGVRLDLDDYVYLRNLEIRNWRMNIYVQNGGHQRIQYCDINSWRDYDDDAGAKGVGGIGVYIYWATDVLIENCTIWGQHYGIYLGNSTHPVTVTAKNTAIVHNLSGVYGTGTAGTFNYEHCLIFWNVAHGYGSYLRDSYGTFTANDLGGNVTPTTLADYVYWPCTNIKWGWNIDDIGGGDTNDSWFTPVVEEFYDRGGFIEGAVMCGTVEWNSDPDFDDSAEYWYSKNAKLIPHCWAHQYIGDWEAFNIQYTGSAACTLSIADGKLTTSGCDGNTLDYDLYDSSYDMIGHLCDAIDGVADYTCSLSSEAREQTHSYTLADVSSVDITSTYMTQVDEVRFDYDNPSSCWKWLDSKDYDGTADVHTQRVYVWPGGNHDDTAKAYLASEGIWFGRHTAYADTPGYEDGVDLAYFPSWKPIDIQGRTDAEIREIGQGDVLNAKIFCHPKYYFSHRVDDSTTWTAQEMGKLYSAVVDSGAQWVYIQQWVEYLRDELATFRWARGSDQWVWVGKTHDFRPRPTCSDPRVDQGESLGFATDILGIPIYGAPDIGAYECIPREVAGTDE